MKTFAAAGFALCVASAATIVPSVATAYDPCQRALEDRAIARDAMNTYIGNQCPASARHIPSECNNPQRGWNLLENLNQASYRVQQQCNG